MLWVSEQELDLTLNLNFNFNLVITNFPFRFSKGVGFILHSRRASERAGLLECSCSKQGAAQPCFVARGWEACFIGWWLEISFVACRKCRLRGVRVRDCVLIGCLIDEGWWSRG
jgi:hypothetical protein